MRALLGVGQRHRPANAARGSRDEGATVSKAPGVAHGLKLDVRAASLPIGRDLDWSLLAFSQRQWTFGVLLRGDCSSKANKRLWSADAGPPLWPHRAAISAPAPRADIR